MTFDPNGFLDVGRALTKEGKTEADYRTAISRFLYGVFLRAREELEARGQKVKASDPSLGGAEHGNVRDKLKRGKFRHDLASARLGSLYHLRYTSDYDLETTIHRNDAEQALEYVEYIQKTFDTRLFERPPDGTQ